MTQEAYAVQPEYALTELAIRDSIIATQKEIIATQKEIIAIQKKIIAEMQGELERLSALHGDVDASKDRELGEEHKRIREPEEKLQAQGG
jgi:hypothetical protein